MQARVIGAGMLTASPWIIWGAACLVAGCSTMQNAPPPPPPPSPPPDIAYPAPAPPPVTTGVGEMPEPQERDEPVGGSVPRASRPGPASAAATSGTAGVSMEELQRQKAEARRALARLTASAVMHLGREYAVQLTVAETTSSSQASLAGNEVEARLARCMAARLYGEGFKIDPATEIIRNVGASPKERWTWNVEPTQEGRKRRLIAESRALAYVDGRCLEQIEVFDPATLDVEVRVEPDPVKRIDQLTTLINSLQKNLLALATMAGAATGLVFALRKLLASLKPSSAKA